MDLALVHEVGDIIIARSIPGQYVHGLSGNWVSNNWEVLNNEQNSNLLPWEALGPCIGQTIINIL